MCGLRRGRDPLPDRERQVAIPARPSATSQFVLFFFLYSFSYVYASCTRRLGAACCRISPSSPARAGSRSRAADSRAPKSTFVPA